MAKVGVGGKPDKMCAFVMAACRFRCMVYNNELGMYESIRLVGCLWNSDRKKSYGPETCGWKICGGTAACG